MQFFMVLFVIFVSLFVEEEARPFLKSNRDRSSCPRPRLSNGRAKVRARGTVVYYRCRKSYVLIGVRFAMCSQGTWSSPKPICAAKNCPKPKLTKGLAVRMSNSNTMATFSCEEDYIMKGRETAVCIGRTWNATTPVCLGSDGVYGMLCTFENFGCGWTQDKTDDFDWQQTTGSTATAETGPAYDHTLGSQQNGVYLYIESSMPRVPNDTARLLSPVFNERYSYSCFTFWYHVYGRVGAGELRVYVRPVTAKLENLQPRFEVAGNRGNVWQQGMITIEILEEPFQIVIEAKRLNTYFSDIAVDDLKIDRCPSGVDPTPPLEADAGSGEVTMESTEAPFWNNTQDVNGTNNFNDTASAIFPRKNRTTPVPIQPVTDEDEVETSTVTIVDVEPATRKTTTTTTKWRKQTTKSDPIGPKGSKNNNYNATARPYTNSPTHSSKIDTVATESRLSKGKIWETTEKYVTKIPSTLSTSPKLTKFPNKITTLFSKNLDKISSKNKLPKVPVYPTKLGTGKNNLNSIFHDYINDAAPADGVDNRVNPLAGAPKTAQVASDDNRLSYPVTIYVALGVFAAFGAVFTVIGLIGCAVQRHQRLHRRESQIEELKPITTGDTLMEQWLVGRVPIYETID